MRQTNDALECITNSSHTLMRIIPNITFANLHVYTGNIISDHINGYIRNL
jgi:hypothetical protein